MNKLRKVGVMLQKLFKMLIILTTICLTTSCGPDLAQFENLKTPKISNKPNHKMIVVEVSGDPNKTGGKAIQSLFKTFFKINNVKMSAPRARCPKGLDTKKDEWIGKWGLPIPENIEKLPAGSPEDVKIQTWEYGEVAEILHIGSYSSEIPTIESLKKFINDNGYTISGDHEEEYLKGPGMFGKGNPDKYYTIIRYCVKKKL